MTDRHRAAALPLPPRLWRQIAHGTPDPAVLRLLRAARASRNLLLLRALHNDPRSSADRGPASALLAAVRGRAPAVFDALITDPATGVLLADAVRGGRFDTVPVLAAVAGHRARIPFRLEIPVRDGTLALPGLGHVTVPPDTVTARVERGAYGTTVTAPAAPAPVRIPDRPQDGAPGWTPLPRLRFTAQGRRWTVRLDTDAVAGPAVDGPPGAEGSLPDGPRRLGAAWELLVARHPGRADAVRGTVRAVVPLAPRPDAPWLSASFSDAFGLVALAPLDDPADIAAALVHETQHSLLYALQDLTPLLEAPPGTRGAAPWSDRPRPPSALLHGAAAFLVTSAFWRTESAHGNGVARAPHERWRRTAHLAAHELARGDWLTANGHRLVDALLKVLGEWDAEDGLRGPERPA
ncbi:aKG-HExxH-type peptide beta-hydroxylase [Streptomyces sp. HUAS TT20]|uniref:aKG-HExxH-type peptide beta-hydroxylase n=1 Tax=Streptomyces sp. HUAS TT20 TaxID=3447509 RepID=UPI0021DB5C40|nr:HEXXH motif-containing putative peptide modification protein [Streptomyces sp. HUAS 15-9]UXY31369.1 HEXXH motif-containing putative peptide modification protein [Streptomyces sp. HUAS 15-9]